MARLQTLATVASRTCILGTILASNLLADCSLGAPLTSQDLTEDMAVQSSSATISTGPVPPQVPAATIRPADAHGPGQNVPPPAKPPLADEFSKAGIEAFAKYWYEVLSYGMESADFVPLEAITDPAYVTCAKVKAGVMRWHTEGRWTVGGKVLVDGAQSAFVRTPEKAYQVILSVHQTLQWYYQADGTLAELAPGSKQMTDMMVAEYKEGRWTALTAEHVHGDGHRG